MTVGLQFPGDFTNWRPAVRGGAWSQTNAQHESDTGEEVWKGRLGGTFSSSPVMVGDRIYATSEEGQTFIFAASKEKFELLGTSVFATPAICGSRIYNRIAFDERRQSSGMAVLAFITLNEYLSEYFLVEEREVSFADSITDDDRKAIVQQVVENDSHRILRCINRSSARPI